MRIAPDTQTWFEQWAVDGLWFTRDHAWYSFSRPIDLDLDIESFGSVAAECVPSVFASADSYSLGVTDSGTESLVDSFSDISCIFSYSENVGVAGTVAGDGTAGSQTGVAPEATIMCCKVLDAGGSGSESGVWAAVEFSVEANADSYSLGVTDSGAESLVDSFSQSTAEPVVVVEANAGSYSFGVSDGGGEALTDSFSQVGCVVSVDIPNTAFGVTSSVSRSTAQDFRSG